MSCIIANIKISELNLHQTKTQVSADVVVTFILEDDGHDPVLGRMKHNLCIKIKKGAPKWRIMKRLKSSAENRQRAYFDGHDDGLVNIFADSDDTSLSKEAELSLLKELLAIEQEVVTAA